MYRLTPKRAAVLQQVTEDVSHVIDSHWTDWVEKQNAIRTSKRVARIATKCKGIYWAELPRNYRRGQDYPDGTPEYRTLRWAIPHKGSYYTGDYYTLWQAVRPFRKIGDEDDLFNNPTDEQLTASLKIHAEEE